MKISFHGAAQEVTGSCHLVSTRNKKILLDCGAFQGKNDRDKVRNEASLGFDPHEIDVVCNSHGHYDHIGRYLQLVKRGFSGEIVGTSATKDFDEVVLLDSVKIQAEDAKRSQQKPLYTNKDVNNIMGLFGRVAKYGEPIELAKGIRVTYFDAGHILGSSFILLEVEENGRTKKLIFSGDLGIVNNDKPIIRNPESPPSADFVIMESTYGNRSHKSYKESVGELYGAINETFANGGNFYIPTFAVEGAQELIYILQEGIKKGKLPSYTQIYLDSPMAISATEVVKKHPECYNSEMLELFNNGNSPFLDPNVHFTRTVEESKAINDVEKNAIVLAGSGMASVGRIVHHMKRGLPKKENGFGFLRYAAEGTKARKIIEGAETVRIFGKYVPVRANIYTIGGFSAHAGQDGLVQWHDEIEPKKTFLVHGDTVPMTYLAQEFRKKGFKNVEMPRRHSTHEV